LPQKNGVCKTHGGYRFVKFMDVQGDYFSPECANIIAKTLLFAL
jgi:hypothetical protein